VSQYAPIEQQVTSAAEATCTAQQADPDFAATHGGKTFDQYYGSGKKDRNAFANCVSTVTKANRQAEQQGRMNPARTCRSTRTTLGTSLFNLSYGKNKNDRNAFGKCVSTTAHLQAHNELSASALCAAEQADTNFASTHDGRPSTSTTAPTPTSQTPSACASPAPPRPRQRRTRKRSSTPHRPAGQTESLTPPHSRRSTSGSAPA
jgi:hypothetical protein